VNAPEPPDPEDFRPEEILEVRRIAQTAACALTATLAKSDPTIDRQQTYEACLSELEMALVDCGQMCRGVPEYESPDDVLAKLRAGDTRKGRQG
jgi:hypothetical protein